MAPATPEPVAPAAPETQPVAPAAPEPEPVHLPPVAPAPEPHAEPALPAMAPEPVQPAALVPAQPAELEPVQPSEPEGVQSASSSHDYFAASEQAASPPPVPELITEPEPVEVAQPEVQPVTLTAPAPEPVEAPAVVIEAAAPELPSIADVPVTAPEPVLVDEPMVEPSIDLGELGSTPGTFRVVVRLSDGDGVEVGEFRDFGTAMHGAQEVIEQFANANGTWPFYAGRFIRPDLIISVDVVDGAL